jgi:hypothetical protein
VADDAPIPIATDGFVLLRANWYYDDGLPFERSFGWQADVPLALDTRLHLSWTRDSSDGWRGQDAVNWEAAPSAEFIVVGEPTLLPTPKALLGQWHTLWHGVGDQAKCDSGGYCEQRAEHCVVVAVAAVRAERRGSAGLTRR